ncbi:MAG: PAS domain-containing sensor histidine kinase [Anaerolineales bacterium]
MATEPDSKKTPSQPLPAAVLHAVLNAVDDGVLLVSASGEVQYANRPLTSLTGIPPEAIVGKRLDLLTETALQALGLTPQQAAEFPHLPQTDTTPHRYQVQETFLERYTAPVTGAHGQPQGWVLVFRDVTDEHFLAQNREQLTETLIHDMRSPLGAVQTSLELLEEFFEEMDHDPLMDQTLGVAQRASSRVLTLVNSLMDIRHLDSGQIKVLKAPFDLSALVMSLMEEIVPQSVEDQVFLTYSLPADLPMVKADQGVVQRVLVNLVDNALKFTPEGGKVWVHVEVKDGKAVLSVTDTGPGIPKRFRQEVFARFVQVPGARSKRRGAGLGLAYCKVAIEAHGEKIWIEEGDKGVGTRVKFSLPLVKAVK